MKDKLPQRKHPRLKNYDYSSAGAYYITICIQNRKCLLSRIVGRGLAPAENNGAITENVEDNSEHCKQIEYTKYGAIAEEQLLLLEKRYPCVTVDRYVIMPNHIHLILILNSEAAGASPRPTIMDVICAYKSLTTRECTRIGFKEKLFQTSFYKHVIDGRDDYNKTSKYIYENPMRWYYDELYSDE